MEEIIEKIIEDIPTEDTVKMYVKFNEDKTYGFYHVEEHGEEITEDSSYIPITDDAYQHLMENQGLKMIGELPEGIEEITIDHIIDVPEQEPAPPTARELVLQQKDLAIKLFVPTLPDEDLLQVPLLVDEWEVGVDYIANKSVVRYGDDLFRVITSHKSQADWAPDVALTLFSRISRPGEILAWKQGSYTKGTKVTHNGFTWESIIDNNVWEPGVVDETIWKKIA